jgi:hypothetical protein
MRTVSEAKVLEKLIYWETVDNDVATQQQRRRKKTVVVIDDSDEEVPNSQQECKYCVGLGSVNCNCAIRSTVWS